MIFIPKIFTKVLIVLALILQIIVLSSCQNFASDQNKTVITDLESICQNISIPNNYKSISSEKTVDFGKVAIFRRFVSKDSCENTKEYFFNYFINSGWERSLMKVEQNHGGMPTLDFSFRTKEYVIVISCENDITENSEKQIEISCSWGLLK